MLGCITASKLASCCNRQLKTVASLMVAVFLCSHGFNFDFVSLPFCRWLARKLTQVSMYSTYPFLYSLPSGITGNDGWGTRCLAELRSVALSGCWILLDAQLLPSPCWVPERRGLGPAEDGLLYWSVMGVPDGSGCTRPLEWGTWGTSGRFHDAL